MKELFKGLLQIIQDSMTVFNKDAMTGRLSFGFLDCIGYCIIPILIFVATIYADFAIDKTFNSSIIGVLSIFVVLAFQVVYIATDKFTNRVNDKIKERTTKEEVMLYDDDKNYMIRMRNYTIQFVRQLALLLLLSLFIILCSSLGLCLSSHIIQVSLSALILSTFYIWLVLLLKIIISIYKLQLDDIEHNYKKIKK